MSTPAESADPPAAIVIFGASGDLTQRKLVPALHSLACEGRLAKETRVVGVARSALSDDALNERLFEGVSAYSRHVPGVCDRWPEFARRISYLSGDYDDGETYRRLAAELDTLDRAAGTRGNRLFYLAVPPLLYPTIVRRLGEHGLGESRGWARIIVEKPFGRDLASAHALNAALHEVFAEERVYRIDHYLGKETVQNILVVRFGNSIFEPLWDRNHVDHVQITMAEDLGLAHRAGYYDHAGVMRDIFQNHMLQLLSLIAMEPPYAFNAKSLRDEKLKVLHAVRPIAAEDAVFGQYQGYREEPDVAADSHTPTYAALELYVDNWRWQGVPFYLRSGKCLAAKTTEVVLQFKGVPHLLFAENADLPPNRLSLYIQPDEGVHLHFATKVPGAGMRVAPADMEFHFGARFGERTLPDAYERLLLDALQGDAALFARSDEIERAWELIEPLVAEMPLARYAPGSWGPAQADALLARDGRNWVCSEARLAR